MSETSELKELYIRKVSFPAYRLTREAELLTEDNEANALHSRLRAAKEERRALIAQADHKIATLKMELLALGQPISKTERTKQMTHVLREEKKEIDALFDQEVQRRVQMGQRIPELIQEVGASNGTAFYASINKVRPSTAESQSVTRGKVEDSWLYTTHRPLHRYAFNEARTLIRMHSVNAGEEPIVLTYPDATFYSGNRQLEVKFDIERAKQLEEILDGTFEGEIRELENPYDNGGN